MADEDGDKTELPTDRKRTEVREQGNVARSTDLNAACLLLAAATAMSFMGVGVVGAMGRMLEASLQEPAWERIDTGLLVHHLGRLGQPVLEQVIPFMLIMAVAALASNFLQVGFLISTDVLQPKFSRLNPWEGLKRILSPQGAVKLAISLAKLSLLSAVAGWFIWSHLPRFVGFAEADIGDTAGEVGESLIAVGFWIALALISLALADYGFQWWKFEQDLMMTKEEIREEMKNMEGDPHIRQRRREAHRKLTTSRELQQVATADVVVTNPTEIAVAIKYDAETMAAPIVVAKGQGHLAARIRALAAEHGVPIVEKKPLARALYKTVKVGGAVPTELYEVVAEILAYVYRLSGKVKR